MSKSASARGFDQLAPIYRALEFLALGRTLERARFAHLELLRDCESILVVGEGDGRCLERLVQVAPRARIDCLDLSPGMLARARRRLRDPRQAERVAFRRADVLTADLGSDRYDAAVTLFFLDCFTKEAMERVMDTIEASLRPAAIWLWADFAVPPSGFARIRARIWLEVLYRFFRWQTRLPASELPPAEPSFHRRGFAAIAESTEEAGLVRSVAWRRIANSR